MSDAVPPPPCRQRILRVPLLPLDDPEEEEEPDEPVPASVGVGVGVGTGVAVGDGVVVASDEIGFWDDPSSLHPEKVATSTIKKLKHMNFASMAQR